MKYTVNYELLPLPMADLIPFEGMNKEPDHKGIPIEELSETDAESYGEELKQAFIRRWNQGQAMRDN